MCLYIFADLGAPFFPGGPELWHHPLAYSAAAAAAAAAELPGTALQHATLVHPALHPQVPVRSYLWLSADPAKTPMDSQLHQAATAQVHHHVSTKQLLNKTFDQTLIINTLELLLLLLFYQ